MQPLPLVHTGPSVGSPPGGDRAVVSRVVDGDTLEVMRNGRRTRVRLIGMDTPETVDPRRPDGCFGAEATKELRRLMSGGEVLLQYDVDRADRFGRTLAYVFLADGTFVNLDLVRRGFARVLTVPPNVAHAEEFRAAEREARQANTGLWNPEACP